MGRAFVFAVLAACGTSSPDVEPEPTRLSQTGLYADLPSRTLASDVLAFAPADPLFSDGEEKHRWLRLPPGTAIDTTDMDHWRFPVGTKAWKEFRVDGKLVETRLLIKYREDGRGIENWRTYAFVWDEAGTDAELRPEGVPRAHGTNHDVPSDADCRFCHGNVRDGLIGVAAVELAQAASSGDLAARGYLSAPLPPFEVPGAGTPAGPALAYLHANCGFCHNDEGSLRAYSPMRLRLRLSDRNPADTGVYRTTFGTRMRHSLAEGVDRAIVPGNAAVSQIWVRLSTTGLTKMPPKGPKLVDAAGSAAVRAWIDGLPAGE